MKLMVDIETLGLAHNAVILEIGAVVFNDRCEIITSYRTPAPSIADQLNRGALFESGTFQWWCKTPESLALCCRLISGTANTTGEQLKAWVEKVVTTHQLTEVWVNGLSFDAPKLEWLNQIYGCGTFWGSKYRIQRDLRTAMAMAGVKKERFPAAQHSAVSDCERQIEILRACYETLRS
jgi:hypothetical protein